MAIYLTLLALYLPTLLIITIIGGGVHNIKYANFLRKAPAFRVRYFTK
jgi:hypothetical protein